jgi:hypothetical protein
LNAFHSASSNNNPNTLFNASKAVIGVTAENMEVLGDLDIVTTGIAGFAE